MVEKRSGPVPGSLQEAHMWLVATSIALFYGLLVLVVLGLGRAAKVGDQIHRRAAEEWLAERRASAAQDRKSRPAA
jgi:hypothetical protein